MDAVNPAIKVGDDAVVTKSGRLVHVLHIETIEHEARPTTVVVHTDWGPYDYRDLTPRHAASEQ